MQVVDLLIQIREKSILFINHELSVVGENDIFNIPQLQKFFDFLEESVCQADPKIMLPLIDEWLYSSNRSRSNTLLEVTDQFLLGINKIAFAELTPDESGELLKDLLPIFSFTNQHIHAIEIDMRISEISKEFDHERSSLERLDKSKTDFISIAAHELKTPLTLMEGYSAMLREIIEQKKVFDEHIFSLIDGIDSGSRRLREIISDMIDVSLIDNDMLSLNIQPTWLNKILERIYIEVKDALESRQITMTIYRFPGDDTMNFYDGERLLQAIYNVITNAIKYTPDGGKIEVSGRSRKDVNELVIIDNGIGIDLIDQVRIFEKLQPIGDPTYHSSGKLKFKGGGPGLGLPIAKGIIEAHGGRIWVESDGYDEINCPGSAFHILLPDRSKPRDMKAATIFEPLLISKQGPVSKK